MRTYKPYSKQYFAPVPTKRVVYFRTSLIWQFIRFVAINIKMIRMIAKSHH